MAKIIDPDNLTYLVDGSPTTQNLRFNTTTKKIQLVAGGSLVAKDGVTGQCLFSKIKEVIKADANLIKYALPIKEMIHDESMELANGWTFEDTTTIKMVRDCGVAYTNVSGIITAMFACFVTLGPLPAAADINTAIYFTQSSASNASTATFTHINTGTTFGVNELVQIYSDTNGDGTPDYDYRSYAKLFLRPAGYTYDESSNVDIGYPALTYKKYNFPITCGVDAGVTVSDATLAGYAGMSITWGATSGVMLGTNGPYSYGVTIAANTKTHDQVYSWVQYQLRQTGDIDTAGGTARNGNVAAALVFMDGATLRTKYQAGIGGVHVTNINPSSYNNIAEADNTQAYRTYPYTAAVTFEFDSFLQADAANAKYWIYDAATYPGAGATLLKDASANDMTGDLTGNLASKTFSYVWTVDKAWIGVAVGKNNAKVAIASGTIQQSTGNKGVFVAGLERWYVNPA
jgi:hypothetical protein